MNSPAIEEVAPQGSPATEEDLAILAEQLGRRPRGVWAIGARDCQGTPLVAVTWPRLPDGTPFPTLFYLTHPDVVRACSVLEAEHMMEELAERFPSNYEAHKDYLRRRSLLEEVEEISNFSAGGLPTRVKCLHAMVAHSLAVGPGINPVGDAALEIVGERGLWNR